MNRHLWIVTEIVASLSLIFVSRMQCQAESAAVTVNTVADSGTCSQKIQI